MNETACGRHGHRQHRKCFELASKAASSDARTSEAGSFHHRPHHSTRQGWGCTCLRSQLAIQTLHPTPASHQQETAAVAGPSSASTGWSKSVITAPDDHSSGHLRSRCLQDTNYYPQACRSAMRFSWLLCLLISWNHPAGGSESFRAHCACQGSLPGALLMCRCGSLRAGLVEHQPTPSSPAHPPNFTPITPHIQVPYQLHSPTLRVIIFRHQSLYRPKSISPASDCEHSVAPTPP